MRKLAHVMPVAMLLLAGCGSNSDERLLEMAREHAARQAESQRQMVQLQHEVAEGSRQLVEADAKARETLTTLQEELRTDQAEVGRQRDQMEAERRTIRRDPILAAAIMQVGLVLAGLLPLLVLVYVFWSLRQTSDTDVAELLVEELVSERPMLLPGPSLTGPPALPSPAPGAAGEAAEPQ